MGYLVFSSIYSNGLAKNIVCKNVNITLLDSGEIKLISQRDVALILEQYHLNPLGKTIRGIKSEEIEKKIHCNKMVKTVECYKTPSGTVNINIKQRCPEFRVVGFGSYYIDKDRKVLPISSNYAAYVPVVSGRVTVSMATGKLFDLISYINNDKFWDAQIEQIHVREDAKIELIQRVGDAVVMLGTVDNYESKLEKLRKLYIYVLKESGWNRYEIIDLQYKDQVVCTKKNDKSSTTVGVSKVINDSIFAKKL